MFVLPAMSLKTLCQPFDFLPKIKRYGEQGTKWGS
jgi:hypothetical protein